VPRSRSRDRGANADCSVCTRAEDSLCVTVGRRLHTPLLEKVLSRNAFQFNRAFRSSDHVPCLLHATRHSFAPRRWNRKYSQVYKKEDRPALFANSHPLERNQSRCTGVTTCRVVSTTNNNAMPMRMCADTTLEQSGTNKTAGKKDFAPPFTGGALARACARRC
jgi:hypothetical protein